MAGLRLNTVGLLKLLRWNFPSRLLLFSSLFLLKGDAFHCNDAFCRGLSRQIIFNTPFRVTSSNLGDRLPVRSNILLSRSANVQDRSTGKSIHATFADDIPKNNKSIHSTPGNSQTSGLFPLKVAAKITLLPMATGATSEDANETNQSMMHRIWFRMICRLRRVIVTVLKVIFVKPVTYLKSIISGKGRTDAEVPEDEETFITSIENLAAEEEATGESVAAPALESKSVSAKLSSVSQTEYPDENRLIKSFAADIKTKVELTKSVEQKTLHEKKNEIAPSGKGLQTAPVPTGADSGLEISAEAELQSIPRGERWAISSPDIDLTGHWKIKVNDDFKKQYDEYLFALGQPLLVRSIALSIIGMTKEETKQSNHGRDLWIKGVNTRGVWERTLHASGSDYDVHIEDFEDYEHRSVPIVTADSEKVEAQSWWENEGSVHVSWLRGGKKYGGGDFYSRRYLEDEGNTFKCETVFHPQDESREDAHVTWTFERER